MEIKSAYANRMDAEAALASFTLGPGAVVCWDRGTSSREPAFVSLTLGPGAVVCWDRGTSSREPARPCDWPALVLALYIEERTDGMYAVMAFVLVRGKRVRRYNARFVRQQQ